MSAPGGRAGVRAPTSIAEEVRRGLTSSPKRLPPHLFYDDAGSALYEQITELPEYYPTRTERAIFEAHADALVAPPLAAALSGARALGVVELGAGSATKTQLLLRAVLRGQPACTYVPVDVSPTAIDAAVQALRAALPAVRVRPIVGTNGAALAELRDLPPPQLVLFIGSSVGNLEDADAAALLSGLARSLGPETWLLLGTDLRKDASVLVPAYDDAAGVTAAFNKNVLVRINRELGGHFDLARFRHVARWNERASRIEMHLESLEPQGVAIDGLGLTVRFDARETIHTESSIKYDLPRVERLLDAGGFRREATFHDEARLVAVHLARAARPR